MGRRQALLEIIEDRHNKRATIITSQLPVDKWHPIIGENAIADAILDRLVHQSHRIELKGASLRTKPLSSKQRKGDGKKQNTGEQNA